MAADDPQLKFRVPADLRKRLENAAEANHRSISAEVVERLERSFSERMRRLDRNAERMEHRIEGFERQLQRILTSINSMREESREIREHPEGLDRMEVARRAGRDFYLKHWPKPFSNPYPEDTVEHSSFGSGYRSTALNHIGEWDADEHARLDSLFVGRDRWRLEQALANLAEEKAKAALAESAERPNDETASPSPDNPPVEVEDERPAPAKRRRNVKLDD